MAQYYELVVYTDQLPTYADPILDRLDPQRFIQYRLYRDSTQYINGKHVSILSLAFSASQPCFSLGNVSGIGCSVVHFLLGKRQPYSEVGWSMKKWQLHIRERQHIFVGLGAGTEFELPEP